MLISQNALAKTTAPKPDAPPTPGADEVLQPKTAMNESKPKSNKKRSRDEQKSKKSEHENEMKRLEGVLFGSLYAPPEFGSESKPADPSTLFIEDRSTDNQLSVYEEDQQLVSKENRKPAWFDEEEERTQVDIRIVNRLRKLRKDVDEQVISGSEYVERLRAQHMKLNPGTDWARAGSDQESGLTAVDEEDSDFLRSNDELVVKDTVKLLPGLLEFSRLENANKEERSNSVINSVQFHRNGQLLLTAGLDRRLRLFQVDGKRNPKVNSIFVEDCPIYKASFLPDGSEVILSGRRKFFYSYDLVKNNVNRVGPLTGRDEKSLESFEISPDSKTIAFVGNEGYILLVSAKTKQLIGTLKMNGTVRSMAFAENGTQLLSSGGDGQVYHWDIGTRKCIHVGTDEGSLLATSLCVSPDSSLFCTGSSSGIVNLYKRDEFLGGKRKPVKIVKNLTTEVNEMRFNHDAQILAICSRMKSKAVRLVHVSSGSVFSNWPSGKLGLARCLDFSPNSGFLTVGNAEGQVLLYKLHHYQKA
ncbi:U3 small nucleolar RNA-associated protein 18 [Carex littledalei]|uniref:U3 small nucleolar RNA-associated protein 18 homolog n=1 Tax=Carex littledalei TaxID=544730 RepID=A0A833QM58_9POAL|nr:U3 small nucleolar RNA-associated protein 18 [Carex littledalei]